MQQYRDTDYAAVSAALHAREAKLLTQAMAERMIDAATPEESYKTLLECGYAPLERCTLENVEHALSQARRELYREVSVLAPDKRIIELFQIKYDYHNAKLALKSKRTGEDVSRLEMDCGRFDAQEVLRGETSAVSAAMSRAMAQAHIFNLGRKSVINGINSPAVIFINEEVRATFINHRFNREHHTRNQ